MRMFMKEEGGNRKGAGEGKKKKRGTGKRVKVARIKEWMEEGRAGKSDKVKKGVSMRAGPEAKIITVRKRVKIA